MYSQQQRVICNLIQGTLLDPSLVGVTQWVVYKLVGVFFGEGGRQTFTNQDVYLKSSIDEISPRGGVERQNILKPCSLLTTP